MAREFHLPDLGSGLQEAEVLAWKVSEGDEVCTEGILCEVETEKAVVEIPVPFNGVVLKLAVAEGEPVSVGDVLAVIGEAGEAADNPVETEPALADLEGMIEVLQDQPPVTQPQSTPELVVPVNERPRAMPSIRKLARERGIDLDSVSGSGKAGRITRDDIERQAKQTVDVVVSRASTKVKKLSMLRQSIARNMAQAWQEIPHCFIRLEVDVTWFLESRRVLGERYGIKVPIEALLIKAVVPALKEFPKFNATLHGDELHLHQHYDIGVAVDTPDGLIVPVVENADHVMLRPLCEQLTDLVQRTVERRAAPAELSGATFTVNNIGALGGIMGTSIIPPGTTAILSIGRAQQKPVVREGKITIVPMMEVALSFDHRVLDGGDAQHFMKMVGANIEQPVRYLALDLQGNHSYEQDYYRTGAD